VSIDYAEIAVNAVPFDYSLKDTPLNYVELKDGIQEEEALVMNEWVAAFFRTYGELPDRKAVQAFVQKINRSGRSSFSYNAKTMQFSGRSPHPLEPGQLRESEPEPEPEPDNVHVLDAETTHDVPVQRVLGGAKHLDIALVLGYEPDGEFYVAASTADPWTLHTLLRKALARIEGVG